MDYIENLTEKYNHIISYHRDQGYYVDLFVRQSNTTAIKLYEAFGILVHYIQVTKCIRQSMTTTHHKTRTRVKMHMVS